MSSISPSHPARRGRRSAPRTKSGCISCRIRRKKCDEVRPECMGCIRNGLICSFASYPPTGGNRVPPEQLDGGYSKSPTTGVPALAFPSSQRLSINGSNCSDWGSHARWSIARKRRAESVHATGLSNLIRAPGARWADDHTSRLLLEHYATTTADQLCGITGPRNPFLAYILPLAHMDDLIMQSVLALSGIHLLHYSGNETFKKTTWMHYGLAIRGMKEALTIITKYSTTSESDDTRLLVVALLLAHVEAVSGNFEGASFHHLRAGRRFALSLIKARHDDALRGFLLEIYAYLALVGNITLNLESKARSIQFDEFMFSLLDSLAGSEISGVMFGCAHGLFELIPRICQLGFDRQEEWRKDSMLTTTSLTYASLWETIVEWKPPEGANDGSENSKQLLVAAEMYRHSVLVYLHTTFYGSSVSEPVLAELVDMSTKECFPLMEEFERWDNVDSMGEPAPIVSTLLWPIMIMGSCMRQRDHQQRLRLRLLGSRYNMMIVQRAIQLLNWLWDDPSEYAYGPYGLEMTMKKQKVNFCMA